MTEVAKVSRLQLQAYNPLMTVQEAMHFARAAALEAFAEARREECSEEEAAEVAGQAYRNALPALSCRGNVQAYIAAVAEGVALTFINAPQARVMLCAAKLAIAAHAEVR